MEDEVHQKESEEQQIIEEEAKKNKESIRFSEELDKLPEDIKLGEDADDQIVGSSAGFHSQGPV